MKVGFIKLLNICSPCLLTAHSATTWSYIIYPQNYSFCSISMVMWLHTGHLLMGTHLQCLQSPRVTWLPFAIFTVSNKQNQGGIQEEVTFYFLMVSLKCWSWQSQLQSVSHKILYTNMKQSKGYSPLRSSRQLDWHVVCIKDPQECSLHLKLHIQTHLALQHTAPVPAYNPSLWINHCPLQVSFAPIFVKRPIGKNVIQNNEYFQAFHLWFPPQHFNILFFAVMAQ